MASIFNATRGAAPALKQQVQPRHRTAAGATTTTTTRKRDGAKAKAQQEEAVPGGVPQGFRVSPEPASRSLRGEDQATFYTSRHYPHYQGQEAEPVYEHAVCPGGARDAVRKQGRSRHPKLNGCDLYVCRVTKTGEFGCSKPCWRCVDWCAWAGIRRIFHWSVVEGRFICIKVRDASRAECYETIVDLRLARASLS
ncbi:hypothetical protein B0H13DRAFT_2083390 [Mycena leptocephala]|nr:hypothetical protein B0H13DRAFT_2083390 [Mycena leptocephala]